jgi:hypothetical protein
LAQVAPVAWLILKATVLPLLFQHGAPQVFALLPILTNVVFVVVMTLALVATV